MSRKSGAAYYDEDDYDDGYDEEDDCEDYDDYDEPVAGPAIVKVSALLSLLCLAFSTWQHHSYASAWA